MSHSRSKQESSDATMLTGAGTRDNRRDVRPVHMFGLCVEGCDHDEPDEAQVDLCRAWLRRWTFPRASLNTRLGSYELKHRVENATREPGVTHLQIDRHGRRWGGPYVYVTNGAFIRAALLEGYRVKPCSAGSPNAVFNIAIRKVPLLVVAMPGEH